VILEPDEAFDVVSLGETLDLTFPVLVDSAEQIRRDACVERAVGCARKDIDARLRSIGSV
jgi:hypothetical protein